MFKSYPSVGDMGLYLAVVTLYRHVFPRKSRHPSYPASSSNEVCSYAVHVLCDVDAAVCEFLGAGVLSPVDLRGERKRKLLLRHHLGVVFGDYDYGGGRGICDVEGRVGDGETGDEGQGGGADMSGLEYSYSLEYRSWGPDEASEMYIDKDTGSHSTGLE